MAEPVRDEFRCPGEPGVISRAVHLGRLASFYPACRDCPHRHDTGTLSARRVRRIVQTERRVDRERWRTPEGLAGVALNEIDATRVRSFAAAFGVYLQRGWPSRDRHPEVALAHDGRWLAVELVPAASEGLRWAGCDVVELGAATAARLAHGALRIGAAGALLVGNPLGLPHTVGIKLWGPDVRPLSRDGQLDAVEQIERESMNRPSRQFGGLSRRDFSREYLDALRPHYHALRPLRVVLDWSSILATRSLAELSAPVACEFIPAELKTPHAAGQHAGAATNIRRPPSPALPHRCTSRNDADWPVRQRWASLAAQVVAQRAHFGLWTDGDGEAIHLVDELGQSVSTERLLLAFVRDLPSPRSTVVALEEGAEPQVEAALASQGLRVVRCRSTREATDAALRQHDANWGAGPSGRLWCAESPGAPDALRTLTLLLVLMSQSDRTLSEITADALASPRLAG